MVLSTHAVVGTIVATTFTTNPYLAFCIAFASHFILDPIPHWDYKLHSLQKDTENNINHDMVFGKTFLFDLLRIGTDALIGLIVSIILVLYILKISTLSVILASVIGGILPDPLQFLYWKTRSKLLLPLHKFHVWIHGRSLKIHYLHGASLQILIVLLFLSISLIIK